MKLFAFYVGGEHPGAHIEVHDMRFIAADSAKGAYDDLRAQWWGTPGTLHVDCWAEIDRADGFDVSLRPESPSNEELLFYVNLGGYDPAHFAEQRRNMFVVARNPTAAKTRALATIADWKDAHRDDIHAVDDVIGLSSIGGLHVHLAKSDREELEQPRFQCRYTPLK